jgi:hypothetical protein
MGCGGGGGLDAKKKMTEKVPWLSIHSYVTRMGTTNATITE